MIKNLRYNGAKKPLQCMSMQKDQLCVFHQAIDRNAPLLYWAKEQVSWVRLQLTCVLFAEESRFTLKSNSGCLQIWRKQRNRHNNPTMLKNTITEGVKLWFG
ncbi:hypothetical protein TNCV_897221 [Trichonephila clavipes]|nr:hypothetical protein TNCV_897221 [Trichonephila clavipes]